MGTRFKYFSLILIATLYAALSLSQTSIPYLSNLHAGQHAPIYTGYAAAIDRSTFTPDLGWRLQYDKDSLGICFLTEQSGIMSWRIKAGNQWEDRVGTMYKKPVITMSYPDMVLFYYYPEKNIRVEVSMVVHSSVATFWQFKISNESDHDISISFAPYMCKKKGDKFKKIELNSGAGEIYFEHSEVPDSWTVGHQVPYSDLLQNLFCITGSHTLAIKSNRINLAKEIFSEAESISDSAKLVGFRKDFSLMPYHSDSFRIFRVMKSVTENRSSAERLVDSLSRVKILSYQKANEKLFSRTPSSPFKDSESSALYWSACNMMRQVFYPPEGNLKHNYYVFSREPHWGWGHGGQVFHESISMLAYAYIDPVSAMNSQRVFADRQHSGGYINYRTGAYLDEVIEEKGQLTSSAPWYSWLNWEVYKITLDKSFLRQMYQSSKKFYNYYTSHRDTDQDGLCEWGGEAVLESVRDSRVAVWDQVGYPSEFESLDLNCMLVMEAKSLENMAKVLGLKNEAQFWSKDYRKRSKLINKTFWDSEDHFYYNVNKKDHSFTYKKRNDLKRKEIIGFLPLWAGIADRKQAKYLVKHLTDTASFWRPYGVPSLAANDPYYNPRGYWNGPVWIQWDYLIERGLLDYGYKGVAKEMVQRVKKNMIEVLKSGHELWEFYDPDSIWGGYHRTYIWAGIINRMMMDIK